LLELLRESSRDMALFGRKKGKAARRTGDRASGEAGAAGLSGSRKLTPEQTIERRLTQDLSRAQTLATMLAQSRAAGVVEVADLLAAMYIYDWERLSQYWEEQDKIEEYLQQICRISPQRWHHWIQFYDQQHRSEEPRKIWHLPKGLKPAKTKTGEPDGKPLRKSAELQDLLRNAEELSPARDFVDGRPIPILTCECVLLAIAKKTDSEIGHRLVATGLNVISLEESARNPKHAPKH
jgi:hypothetical protein